MNRRLHLTLFLLGLSVCVPVRFLGILTLSEVLCALLFPVAMIFCRNWIDFRMWKLPVIAFLFLFFGALLSDFVNNTPIIERLKAIGQICLMASTFAAFMAIFSRFGATVWAFYLGWAIGSLSRPWLFEETLVNKTANFQTWYGGTVIAVLLVLFGVLLRYSRIFGVIGFLLSSGIAILNRARLESAVLFLGAGVIGLPPSRRFHKNKGEMFRFLTSLALLALVLGVFSWFGYAFLADRGLLGDSEQERFLRQSQNPFGLIGGARPILFGGILAVIDRPFFGHGYDGEGLEYLVRIEEEFGVDVNAEERLMMLSRTPTHSLLLEGWVEGGLLGALGWIVISYLLTSGLRHLVGRQDVDAIVGIFLCLSILRDVAFNPLNLWKRALIPIVFAFIVFVRHQPNFRFESFTRRSYSSQAIERNLDSRLK